MGRSVYRINGVKVSYIYDNWIWSCKKGSARTAENSSKILVCHSRQNKYRFIQVPRIYGNYVQLILHNFISIGSWCSSAQYFELQSSVQFIEVPLVWHHQNTSHFWASQYDGMSVGCSGDVCWKVLRNTFIC